MTKGVQIKAGFQQIRQPRDWWELARCKTEIGDSFFDDPDAAQAVCRRCPVTAECLAWALSTRQEFGVWGGMTEQQRRDLLEERQSAQAGWPRAVAA